MDRKRVRSPTNSKDDDNQKKKKLIMEDILSEPGIFAFIPPAIERMMQRQIVNEYRNEPGSETQVTCNQSSDENLDNRRHKENLCSLVYNEKHKKQKHKKDDRKIFRNRCREKSENFSDSRAHRRYWDREQVETDRNNESNRHEKNRIKEKRKEYRYSDDKFDRRHINSDRTRPRNFRPNYKNYYESRYQRDYVSRSSRYTGSYDRNQSPSRYRDERYRNFSDDERFDGGRNYADRRDMNANKISEIAETTLEKTSEISTISPPDSILITDLPEIIMIYIFEYLNDGQLDICSQVCTQWRGIVENIMYRRVTMITRKIPLDVLNSAIYESENLRPYVGFDDNFQYSWFVLESESKHTRASISYRGADTQLLLPIEETTEIKISMFPNIPHFNIFNYSLKLFRYEVLLKYKSDLIKKIKNVCHKKNIRDKETKCIMLYKDNALCNETKHFSDFSDNRDVYRLTVFHGERVKVFPVYLYGKTDYTTIEEKLERLKYSELRMIQKRCFVYIFNRAIKENIATATQALRKVFPTVNHITCNILPYYFFPRGLRYYHVVNGKISCITLMVFVWWE
ncbi:uncharacterized protein [Centruroides vittatus]